MLISFILFLVRRISFQFGTEMQVIKLLHPGYGKNVYIFFVGEFIVASLLYIYYNLL